MVAGLACVDFDRMMRARTRAELLYAFRVHNPLMFAVEVLGFRVAPYQGGVGSVLDGIPRTTPRVSWYRLPQQGPRLFRKHRSNRIFRSQQDCREPRGRRTRAIACSQDQPHVTGSFQEGKLMSGNVAVSDHQKRRFLDSRPGPATDVRPFLDDARECRSCSFWRIFPPFGFRRNWGQYEFLV